MPPAAAVINLHHLTLPQYFRHQAVFAFATAAATNLVIVTLLSVAVRRHYRRLLSAADTLIISRTNLLDCCVTVICSQGFAATGDTIGNPAATKTGDTITCHRAAASRREAPPGAWEAGVYLTAGAEVNHQMSPRAVRWDPRLDNEGDTVGGLVVGTTTDTGEGSSIILLVIWRRKNHVGRQESSLPGIFLLSWLEISLLIPTDVTN